MRLLFSILSLSLLALNSLAQSENGIIKNGGFEEFSFFNCQSNHDAFSNYEVDFWETGNWATPDLLFPCQASNINNVPNNIHGFQWPAEGNAYAGIFFYDVRNPRYSPKRWNEYIAQKVYDVKYGDSLCFEFYISLADSSKKFTYQFGVYVLRKKPTYYGGITKQPNFIYSADSIRPDTSSWLKIKGKLGVTDSTIDESAWIIIGSPYRIEDKDLFDTDWNLTGADTAILDSNGKLINSADGYAYIDNVCFSKLEDCSCFDYNPQKNTNELPFPELFIPNVVTPNEDQLNDLFTIKEINYSSTINLKIYNRWGNLVFEDENYKNTWPSHFKMPVSGTYYYIIEYMGQRFKGNVSLLY